MAVDLTDQIPLETGPKHPVTNPVPKLDDIDVEVGDLSPLAAERAADGTRSKLTAAPPPIPMRARRASTMPPPIPSRAARGSAAPRSKVSLVEPKATPEMMASWQINPEAPLSETINTAPPFGGAASPGEAVLAINTAPPFGGAASPSEAVLAINTAARFGGAASPSEAVLAINTAPRFGGAASPSEAVLAINPAPPSEAGLAIERLRPSAPPPIPFAVKAPVSPLPTTIELVRAPEAVKVAETPLLTGNAPSVVTASATALPVVQQEIIPSPRESRVTQLPTSQPGADVADLPVWPMAPAAKTMGEVLAARASSTSLPPPTRDSARLPVPRGRNTVPPPIPMVAVEPAPVATKPATLAAPQVLVAPEVVAKNVSALDGSDGWVFEDDYDERHVDGEVVPTTYFERTEPPPQTRSRFLIAAGGAAAALAVIVGIALHGSSTTPVAKATAKPPVTAPTTIAETTPTAEPTPVVPAAVVPAPVAVSAPVAVPVAAAPSLTTLPITSWPDGATVTLVDNGNATVLGRTPVSAALDPSHSYDVVLAVVGRPTIVKHVDFATMHELAVDLDPVPKGAVAAHGPAPKPHHAAPVNQIAVPNFDAPPAPAAHHHHEAAVAAQEPAPAKPKQVALAAPAGTGTLMVSAKPPCEIVIDGKSTMLTTPQRAIPLAPGAHAVTLINASIGIRKTIAVKVEAKKPTKLIQDFTKS